MKNKQITGKKKIAMHCRHCNAVGIVIKVPGTAALPRGWRDGTIILHAGRDNQNHLEWKLEPLCSNCIKDFEKLLTDHGYIGKNRQRELKFGSDPHSVWMAV